MKVVISAYVSQEVARDFASLCHDKGWSKSKGVEEAIKEMLGGYEPEKLPEGYKRGQGGKLLKQVKTRTGLEAWAEVNEEELEKL